jgi:mannose-1-phosphate guanylyltransferase / mannose-6-phosphate isomerase
MNPQAPTIVPVILSGGAGTRLWPVSREAHPKPFMTLADGQSLLEKTYRRALAACQTTQVVTVTNREYYFSSREIFEQIGSVAHGTFLLEKSGRNTAAAVAMAALHVRTHLSPHALLLVLPSDHLIHDVKAFEDAVARAVQLATEGYLVTFGITPERPETGFGYIQVGEPLTGGSRVRQFVEKPPLERAKEYLASGEYLWNAGMFCFSADVFLRELERHAPDVLSACVACQDALASVPENSLGIEIPGPLYDQVPSISLDHALMEKSDLVAVVPARMGWSDIGSWTAVRDLLPADAQQNRSNEKAVFVDSTNTYVHGSGRLVATVGTSNLIIVDTPDALLVSQADRVQDVKEVVARLKAEHHPAFQWHQTVTRPWGTYTVLGEGPRFKLKRIEVKPGASLSLQMHHHRNEHWIVVDGLAEVTNGDRTFLLHTNESTYIPAEHKHRLRNPGTDPLVMIEVQSGSYLGEDDIVRFEDIYGRIHPQ